MKPIASVALVGAGPGDPELLTLRALNRIQNADVVVYDRLVSPGVLDLIPAGTARIYAGKAADRHVLTQKEINELLVRLARAGRKVVRLKGGDPFIFGRGSEEAFELVREGIPFEVIPGITAASGIGAATGIPLTHRGMAEGVRYVTGHCRSDVNLELDWRGLADPDSTLIIYMGLANLDLIVAKLIENGLSGDTPTAAIQNGTLPNQRQLFSPLHRLPDAVSAAGFSSPMLVIIGRVVALADALNWQALQFEKPFDDALESRPA